MNLRIRRKKGEGEYENGAWGEYTSRQIVKEFSSKYEHFDDNLPIEEYNALHTRILNELLRVSPLVFYNVAIVTGSKRSVFKMIGDFNEQLKDIIPKIGNTYNNAMSINIYLNEKCKDAMNLTDFVENVKVSLEDLLYTKNHGFVKGISNIFVKQLQDMEPTQRPIHCSDKKRLQFYVKDADKWEKDKSHEKIDKTIDEITFKQIKQVKLFLLSFFVLKQVSK